MAGTAQWDTPACVKILVLSFRHPTQISPGKGEPARLNATDAPTSLAAVAC